VPRSLQPAALRRPGLDSLGAIHHRRQSGKCATFGNDDGSDAADAAGGPVSRESPPRKPRSSRVHLTVAKDGPKLTPFREGSCTPVEFGTVIGYPDPTRCHVMVGRGT